MIRYARKCSVCSKYFANESKLAQTCSVGCHTVLNNKKSNTLRESKERYRLPKHLRKKKQKQIKRLNNRLRQLEAEKRKQNKKIVIKEDFYDSKAWKLLRYKALRTYGRKCMLCGETDGVIHVDHIKPRSLYPELELDFNNLQILCITCNEGKSNIFEDDWRTNEANKRV